MDSPRSHRRSTSIASLPGRAIQVVKRRISIRRSPPPAARGDGLASLSSSISSFLGTPLNSPTVWTWRQATGPLRSPSKCPQDIPIIVLEEAPSTPSEVEFSTYVPAPLTSTPITHTPVLPRLPSINCNLSFDNLSAYSWQFIVPSVKSRPNPAAPSPPSPLSKLSVPSALKRSRTASVPLGKAPLRIAVSRRHSMTAPSSPSCLSSFIDHAFASSHALQHPSPSRPPFPGPSRSLLPQDTSQRPPPIERTHSSPPYFNCEDENWDHNIVLNLLRAGPPPPPSPPPPPKLKLHKRVANRVSKLLSVLDAHF